MIELADTTIRLYRKKNGKVSVKLRSYLMVTTNVGFSLSAYLKNILLELVLSSGEIIKFNDVSFTTDVECYEMNTMVHGFWGSGILDTKSIIDTVGILTLYYHISFTGHPTEEPQSISYTVPVIKRSTIYDL